MFCSGVAARYNDTKMVIILLRQDINKHLTEIIIIFIYCNWVVTRWQWLFYMYTKLEIGY